MIVLKLRIPRAFLGLFVGGGLSVSGLALQGVFRNNLVEPYTLGISGGAAVAIALGLLFSFDKLFGYFSLVGLGFIGSVLVMVMLYFFITYKSVFDIKNVLLTGVMISFASSALLLLILSLSPSHNLESVIFWMMGSLSNANLSFVVVLAIIVILGVFLLFIISKELNAIQLGYDKSISIGVDLKNAIKIVIFVSSVITGACVSVAGIIGFVGLIVPYFARAFFENDYRLMIPGAFLSGGAFLILSDLISSRIIYPNELPIGVFTGLLGGIFFIYVLQKEGNF